MANPPPARAARSSLWAGRFGNLSGTNFYSASNISRPVDAASTLSARLKAYLEAGHTLRSRRGQHAVQRLFGQLPVPDAEDRGDLRGGAGLLRHGRRVPEAPDLWASNGVWVQCVPYYGADGTWHQCGG